jgi:hypothetical protein
MQRTDDVLAFRRNRESAKTSQPLEFDVLICAAFLILVVVGALAIYSTGATAGVEPLLGEPTFLP